MSASRAAEVMRSRLAAVLIVVAGCARASVAPPGAPTAARELAPRDYCARVATLATTKDATARVDCSCFTQLYAAMRADNPAYYSCSAACVERSADLNEERACEERDGCAERVSSPEPRTPDADARVERYCERMTSLDQRDPDTSSPRLGMESCATLARWMKRDGQREFECAYGCAMGASSQRAYQACLAERACTPPGPGTTATTAP